MLDDAQATNPPDAPVTPGPQDAITAQPDQQLITLVASGDSAALGILIDRHQQRVLSLSYRLLGRRDQAEDAAQEVFIKIYHAAGKYRPEAQFTTWLYRIVVNQCLDMKRKTARAPQALGQDTIDQVGHVPTDKLEARERSQQVQQAVADLPEAQQTALILHRFDGQPIRQIAQVMGRSESAVESLLVRAYAKLRVTLAVLRED